MVILSSYFNLGDQMDLKTMSPVELQNLIANAEKEIVNKKKELKSDCLKALHETAESFGFKLSDFIEIAGEESKPAKTRKPAEAKYRNPENPSETWTGRGIAPKWLQAKFALGMTKEQFAI